MSLESAKMPRLNDKLVGQADEAEKVRAALEKKDQKAAKIIKKASKKK